MKFEYDSITNVETIFEKLLVWGPGNCCLAGRWALVPIKTAKQLGTKHGITARSLLGVERLSFIQGRGEIPTDEYYLTAVILICRSQREITWWCSLWNNHYYYQKNALDPEPTTNNYKRSKWKNTNRTKPKKKQK